ncbi:hypothetical protein [Marinobacter sp. NFXS9]|uniref:hypothetical protein n=1 Tax=Marinobacter sp. NFXS9 TaxID=2818433 RepID=UPI0032DF19CA
MGDKSKYEEEYRARVNEAVELFSATCKAEGYFQTSDLRVSEPTAAALLGYAEGSLRNLRTMGASPPFYKRAAGDSSRISYRLRDLAEWIEIRRDDAVFSRKST